MSNLAPAIRLRRRQLDALALDLAAVQRNAQALAGEAETLTLRRSVERHLAASAPLACDAWFAQGKRRLAALALAQAAADRDLAALRCQVVQARARLQLLEDAAAEARRAEGRRRDARAQAALDDRTAAAWTSR